ncbi:MAG: hypothetical protein JNK70_12240 [Phycisphaerae bacterium]|nr:hypothetical protein [Phycisphaerae bacterium]
MTVEYNHEMLNHSSFVIMIAICSASGLAQTFNVDSGGGMSTPPTTDYGAAADQPGVWNSVVFEQNNLLNTAGQATTVRYATSSNSVILLGIDGAAPNDKLLMDSAMPVDPSDAAAVFSNLQPGLYDLYIYCWAGNLLGPKDVTIRAFTGAGQVVGGVRYGEQWPGQQVLGETYDKLRVEVTPGDGQYIDIAIQAPGDFNVINGVQLVPVPAPGALALAPAALLAGRRRRR